MNAPLYHLIYIYDFGDGWEHEIAVKSFDYKKTVPNFIHCLSAVGACPLEDVGGIWGYSNFCEIMSDPKHPEYEETSEWTEMMLGKKTIAQTRCQSKKSMPPCTATNSKRNLLAKRKNEAVIQSSYW